MQKSFNLLFKEYKKNIKNKFNKIILGKILAINKDFILVDTNLKSESYVPIKEFYDENYNIEVNINDEVTFLLESIDNGNGETIISREKAKLYEMWIKLNNIYKNNLSIIGKIKDKVRGGFTIDINKNINAFLPGSLTGVNNNNESIEEIENKNLEFKLIKIDKKNNNIVLSRKAILDVKNNIERLKIINSLKEGDILIGNIKNITDYGAFIDLGKIDGLLHITDISWKRIKHPSDLLKIGNSIKVKILKFDLDKLRISLGLKQLYKDPWENILEKYPIGFKTKGKVTNLVDYGCFVEIEDGIEGLVHTSEMNWKNKNINPYKFTKIDDIVNIKILNIDLNLRRISMGIKQCEINPWKEFKDNNNIGDKVYCIIKSITEFGIFVEIENSNIDGLIHINDISWDNIDIEFVNNNYKKGDRILTSILQIDIEKERISLGIKQLMNDPFDLFIINNKKGDIIQCTVNNIKDNYIYVDINNNILGCIKLNKNIKNIKEKLSIKAKISNFDKKNRIINLIYINKNDKKNNKGSFNINNIMTEAFKEAKNE